MKKKLVWILACFTAASLLSCNFPYKPEAFVLPSLPVSFVSASEIQSFTGTTNVKIAFTLGGQRDVYFVDFTDSVPTATKLQRPSGTASWYGDSPLISPDGKFVTYYITDGSHAKGAYIQKLDKNATPVLIDANGTEPHWWQDRATGQMYVVYSTTIFVSLNSLTTSAGQTYKIKVSLSGSGTVTGTKEQIAPYPMNGGLSKNGKYLCTGYANAAFYDIISSLLIPIDERMQTCNPSICPDSMHDNRMMFLNIQGKQNLVNPYVPLDSFFPSDSILTEHSVVFIVNTNNVVVAYIPITVATTGTYSELQDPEWSNEPGFAAMLGVTSGNSADGLLVKNIGDTAHTKSVLQFSAGSGKLNATSTPYIWIGE